MLRPTSALRPMVCAASDDSLTAGNRLASVSCHCRRASRAARHVDAFGAPGALVTSADLECDQEMVRDVDADPHVATAVRLLAPLRS